MGIYGRFSNGPGKGKSKTPPIEIPAPQPGQVLPKPPAGEMVDAKLLGEFRAAGKRLHQASAEAVTAAEIAKGKKAAKEEAQANYNTLGDRLAYVQSLDKNNWPENAPLAKAGKTEGEDESWRKVALVDLKPAIPNRYTKALAENDPPIVTLGDLTDWQKKHGDFWAKDITGMGKAGEDALAAATDAFWLARKTAKAPEPENAATPLRDLIVTGRRTDALDAIEEATLAVLQLCQTIGLKGDWRRAAVAKRTEQLKQDADVATEPSERSEV